MSKLQNQNKRYVNEKLESSIPANAGQSQKDNSLNGKVNPKN
jgi:hypothetical protein